MTRTLVVVDIQNDYFPGGAYPLVGATEAGAAAASVLAAFRRSGDPVVHVQHIWDAPDAPFMRPGTPGVEINPVVAPVPGEPVVTKSAPNAFVGTELATLLDRDSTIVVLGMMTSMCVDSTVRSAISRDYDVVVVSDGHTLSDRPHLDAPTIIRHHNWVGSDLLTNRSTRVATTRELLAEQR